MTLEWNELMTKLLLVSCDHHYPPDTATYHYQSLNHKKFNDHFIVSQSLMNDTHLSNFSILEDGDNLSDHFPITTSLAFQTKASDSIPTQPVHKPELKWAKITQIASKPFNGNMILLLGVSNWLTEIFPVSSLAWRRIGGQTN